MIDEVERGNVAVCITKDMSRIGRDYLQVGLLLEKFQECAVRFIAVTDGVDTEKGIDDFTPFRNIIDLSLNPQKW
jgi:DNA invertase Pin-like site-specific DNA recombinase